MRIMILLGALALTACGENIRTEFSPRYPDDPIPCVITAECTDGLIRCIDPAHVDSE